MGPVRDRGGRAARVALAATACLLCFLAAGAVAEGASRPQQRRVVLLGLRARGDLAGFARRVSSPASPRYRHFPTLGRFRRRFAARAALGWELTHPTWREGFRRGLGFPEADAPLARRS